MLRIGVALNVVAVGCIVAALLAGDRTPVEGAYFNRSVGEPAFAGVYSGGAASNQTPWLVSAAVLVVLGTAVLIRATRRIRRAGRRPSPASGGG